jgi:hypothetical protein
VGFEIGQQEYFGNDTALTLTADGPAAWGTDPALPGRFTRTGVRASETVHITAGPHRLKLGGGASFGSYEDTYAYGRAGTFAFGRPDDLLAVDGGFVQSVGREPIASFSSYEFGWFLQDRWNIAPGADLILGFRMDWERVDREALVRNQQLFARSGIATDSIDATRLKLSPRAGFVWDVGNKHTWVVRADGGVYQGAAPNDVFAEAVAEGGARQLRYGTGALGRWPGVPDSTAAAPSGALVSVLPYDFSAPQSAKAALGVSGALGSGTTLHLAGSYRSTKYLTRRRDLNRVPGQSGRDQYGRPIYGTLEQHGSALLATPGSGRRLDEFAVVSALNQDGASSYFGVTARLERRLSRSFTMSAGYTFSQTSDNLPGMAYGPDAQLSPFPDSLNGSSGRTASPISTCRTGSCSAPRWTSGCSGSRRSTGSGPGDRSRRASATGWTPTPTARGATTPRTWTTRWRASPTCSAAGSACGRRWAALPSATRAEALRSRRSICGWHSARSGWATRSSWWWTR